MTIENIEKYKFEDLFDMAEIQKLTDAISEALEIGIVIVSPEGVPITKPSNFCNFCRNVVRQSEKGNRNCEYSDSVLGRKADKPIVSKCLSAGLMDAGISIIIKGKHLASWMVGQVQIEEDMLTEDEQRERARSLGIDEELFLREIQTVPHKTREQFDRILTMIHVIAQQLSELGLSNYLQKEEILHREKLEEELRGEKEKLEQYQQYDELTGVFTRNYYEERLQELVQSERYPIGLISGDMNNLKLCNDVFGHQSGDAALHKLGQILRREAGDHYLIGRCGGDEFCIAIPNCREAEAEDYCRRVQSACNTVTAAMIPPSMSMGWSVLRKREDDLQETLRQAEEAMYNAKVQRKRTQNIHNDIMEVLYRNQYLSRNQVDASVVRIERFARYLKLEEYTVQILKLCANIQDVGLIAVPEPIVKKETRRTPEEHAQMAKHTQIGYRLARLYEESFPAANIILQSHECWFGLGYPNGLKEKEILYPARILYMVTAYSGWIFPRPTGSGMEPAAARVRLLGEAGKQFDPELVAQFLTYLEQEEPVENAS